MTDIVERLQRKVFRGPTMEAVHTKTLEWEAADEITRLRAQNAELVAALLMIDSITVHSGGDIHGVHPSFWEVAFKQSQDTARAALASIETPKPSAAEAQDE